MRLTDQLLAVARTYGSHAGKGLSVVSSRACFESKALIGLESGKSSLTLRRADAAMNWFSDHWPAGAAWPAAVPRPLPSGVPVAAPVSAASDLAPTPPPEAPASDAAPSSPDRQWAGFSRSAEVD